MTRIFLAVLALLGWALVAQAQDTQAQDTPAQDLLQTHAELIVKSSRKTIAPVIAAVADSGLEQAQDLLQFWQAKELWWRKSDGLFFRGEKLDSKTYRLFDLDTGELIAELPKTELKQVKPNSGVRAMIATALVRFQLLDPDPARRSAALDAIERDPEPALLDPLRASIDGETDAELRVRKARLERLLTISFDPDEAARVAAIAAMSGDMGLDLRATLNRLLTTTRQVFEGDIPADQNSAGLPELTDIAAYDLLVAAGKAPARLTGGDIRAILSEHIDGGKVGGIPIAQLNTDAARTRAYAALAEQGLVPPLVTQQDIAGTRARFQIVDIYDEPSKAVTSAASDALKAIEAKLALNQGIDLTLDALSLASIYFLAAIGLAITFGVMGVINMAHGEFIMMGAYTGFVVQQVIPNHTVSILLAVPLAFAVTFAAGVAMERLVIRWLYNRPLETLLATFGISIALQQLAKNIFGTQARPLTAPGWLDGAWVVNDVVSISYIRIAIFVLALVFLAFFLVLMKRTRLGLETRAVTQNRRMAASMGINPDRVNMLTFGLGSGIAGIAGVAIGLFAKVTSELGNDYIVQSFMTVVVGGVGNIWGTLAGATMIGFMQKGIEWLNPSNTLAAQTYMIIFIIIFIQFRPRGIIALKGRAAGD